MLDSEHNSQHRLVHKLLEPFVPVNKQYTLTCVQSLWSGYGEITRCQLLNNAPDEASGSDSNHNDSLIVKTISLDALAQNEKPEHPRAWQSEFAHQRKLSSYRNECRFYQHYSHLTHAQCQVPSLMSAHYNDAQISIVMQDLDAQGLHVRHMQATTQIAATGISWLAHFHARFMQAELNELWPIGTYWHLATRPQEHASMPNSALKDAAQAIDDKLNKAQYKTLLHGDAKLANFCFSEDSTQTAAVDFQYTGKGVGVKDVIYFLGSCFNEHELSTYAEPLVDLYFETLHTSLAAQSTNNTPNSDCAQTTDSQSIEQEWRSLIPFAWADFERFLAGWAPEHKKRHSYSYQQTAKALQALS